jgi:4-hydroxy-3-methylbut-2-enyl diphosphate reductase
MKIIFSKDIGFCFGVKRAVKIVENLIKESEGPFWLLEPIVHNERVMGKLKKEGVRLVTSLKEIDKGVLVISAHGEKIEIYRKAKEKGLKIVDTTCPLVTNAQNLAKKFQGLGYQIFIAGDKKHKEVTGIWEATNKKAIIISKAKDFSRVKIEKPTVLISQTTQSLNNIKKIFKELKKKDKKAKFLNTLCPTCQKRQKEIKELAKKADLILIIGSKSSANTKRLWEIAKNKNSFLVEGEKDLDKSIIGKRKIIAITSGTSTPNWIINEVVEKIKTYEKDNTEKN